MNIRCPNCQSVFRVDPARIPPGGVRARCSRCSAAFQISAGSGAPAPAAAAAGGSAPHPATGRAPHAAGGSAPRAAGGSAPVAPAGGGPPASMTAPGSPAPPSAGASPVAAAGPGSVPVFGTKDPHARAERIARALVSDIVAYHPKKRVDALAAGTMRTEFREEIMKSWEEYVAQVGAELAKGTPYFRNALNDILAQGQRIF